VHEPAFLHGRHLDGTVQIQVPLLMELEDASRHVGEGHLDLAPAAYQSHIRLLHVLPRHSRYAAALRDNGALIDSSSLPPAFRLVVKEFEAQEDKEPPLDIIIPSDVLLL